MTRKRRRFQFSLRMLFLATFVTAAAICVWQWATRVSPVPPLHEITKIRVGPTFYIPPNAQLDQNRSRFEDEGMLILPGDWQAVLQQLSAAELDDNLSAALDGQICTMYVYCKDGSAISVHVFAIANSRQIAMVTFDENNVGKGFVGGDVVSFCKLMDALWAKNRHPVVLSDEERLAEQREREEAERQRAIFVEKMRREWRAAFNEHE